MRPADGRARGAATQSSRSLSCLVRLLLSAAARSATLALRARVAWAILFTRTTVRLAS